MIFGLVVLVQPAFGSDCQDHPNADETNFRNVVARYNRSEIWTATRRRVFSKLGVLEEMLRYRIGNKV